MFFDELKKVRENWRVRKTGDFVYGDIGYSICKIYKGLCLFSIYE